MKTNHHRRSDQKKKENPKSHPKTRKEKRKDIRKTAKSRKHEFFTKNRNIPGKFVRITPNEKHFKGKLETMCEEKSDDAKKQFHRLQKMAGKLKEDMKKKRKKQLFEANKEEDKLIKKLEKQLKLHKRKTNSVPKSFASDGLDYLLEICDSENLKSAVTVEQNLYESGSEIEEDFAAVVSRSAKIPEMADSLSGSIIGEIDGKNDDFSHRNSDTETLSSKDAGYTLKQKQQGVAASLLEVNSRCTDEEVNFKRNFLKRKIDSVQPTNFNQTDTKKIKRDNSRSCNKGRKQFSCKKEEGAEGTTADQVELPEISASDHESEENNHEFWEDIYGRTRDRKGNILKGNMGKYVPPQLRSKNSSEDSQKKVALVRLRKQMKGLLNRLSEANMNSVVVQIEELYMVHSRYDTNEALKDLLFESLIAHVLTPERLIMEHALLVATLHTNVGTEVGTHFVQELVKKFAELCNENKQLEDKRLDNVVLILSHLYNFKVFNSVLMYNLIEKLSETFSEKEIELILIIFRSVGFTLRKDNPAALKDLVLNLQQKAASARERRDNSRVTYMLDILLAIKNNNMGKIPHFDPAHCEHLKKVFKSLIHKGSYITEINFTLDDLLKADEKGRWWIVGSAWSGATIPGGTKKSVAPKAVENNYSSQLLDLAKKQRMNTDLRRDIFCIVMTAEDYLDAFDKLLHLGLKNQQERDIIYVVLDCCLHEKKHNPYYSHLVQKFCDFDRKYQMITQYALWDKLEELHKLQSFQMTNLSRFLIHLFINRGLPISALKVINFAAIDKATIRLLRQVLIGILLHSQEECIQQLLSHATLSSRLHLFTESLRIFIKHFILRNVKSLQPEEVKLLQQRAEMADKILSMGVSKFIF